VPDAGDLGGLGFYDYAVRGLKIAACLLALQLPAALIGAMLNPFGWLFISMGRADRQFRFGILWSSLIISAFAAGLKFGPTGVAAGYSLMSCVLALPLCVYATRGTAIRVRDLFHAVRPPVVAVIPAGGAALALKLSLFATLPAAVRAVAGGLVFAAIYAFVLLVIMKRFSFYRELLHQLFPGRFGKRQDSPASAA